MTIDGKAPLLARYAIEIVTQQEESTSSAPQLLTEIPLRGETSFTRVRNETTDDN